MSAPLAVVPCLQKVSRPDIAWIKKNVPVLEVGKTLGLRIRHGRAKCWRPENHTHCDADPSLHFYERGNRVRCFVCDLRGGHSCIDLVMGFLDLDLRAAVRWIAERFPVPNVKPGHPIGRRTLEPTPYRVGASGSELEVLVRSGMFRQLSAAERSILLTLLVFRDPDSGLTIFSYAGLMRYAGIGSSASVARALKRLARLHAITIHRGLRVGITRECNSYRITLDDPKFLQLCNDLYGRNRELIAQERSYRGELRSKREEQARPRLALNTTEKGGSAPLHPPVFFPFQKQEKSKGKPSTCEGLNLSSLGEVSSNKPLHAVKRVIGSACKIGVATR